MVTPTGKDTASQTDRNTAPQGHVKQALSTIQDSYSLFIEKGKHKLGFYKPEVTDDDRFLMSFLIYFMMLLMVVFVADYAAQLVYEDSNSLYALQETEADLIYHAQKDVFDMPVYLNKTILWYDTSEEWHGRTMAKEDRIGGFGLEVDSVCTGFHEMVFLSVLILGFRGVPVKLRIKWAIILDTVIFVENLFRIFALYPIAIYWGRDFEEWLHYYWWHIGQYIFIMSLFGLWFIFVANKHIGGENVDTEKKKDSEGKDKGKKKKDGEGKNKEGGEAKKEGEEGEKKEGGKGKKKEGEEGEKKKGGEKKEFPEEKKEIDNEDNGDGKKVDEDDKASEDVKESSKRKGMDEDSGESGEDDKASKKVKESQDKERKDGNGEKVSEEKNESPEKNKKDENDKAIK